MTKKILFLLFSFLFLSTSVHAQDSNFPMLTIEEEDGTPSTIPWKLKVPNGSLTSNADYSSSLSFSADSLTAGTLSLSSGSITDSSGAISFGDENVSFTGTLGAGVSTLSTVFTPTINGGLNANDDITIQGTTNATRTTSYVNLQPSGGNVGIGTTTPSAKLEIAGGALRFPQETAGTNRQVISFLGNANMGFWQHNDADSQYRLKLMSWNGTEIFNMDNANIFYGKLSYTPTYEGSIRGKADNSWGNVGKYYRPTNTGNWRLEKSADGNEFQIWNWNNVIINTGNVGIGTTSPAVKLEVALTDTTTDTVSEITRNTHSGGAVVNNFGSYHSEFLEDATAGTIREASRIGTLWTDATDATRTSAITFSGVTSGGALTEWGRFQGNMLGVGITPTYRLHVPWLSGDTVTTAYFGSNNASNNRIAVRGESYNGTGIYGVSTDNIGTGGSSTSSTGIYGASTSGVGTYGASTSGIGGYFTVNPASTNTVVEIIRLRRQTSDTAADGIGGGIDWYLEDSAGTDELTGRISNLLTTATSGSEASALTFWTRTGGAAIAEMARIDGDTTAGNTRFMLYDVDNATLERVSIGAQDSGGAGFKVLRIPN